MNWPQQPNQPSYPQQPYQPQPAPVVQQPPPYQPQQPYQPQPMGAFPPAAVNAAASRNAFQEALSKPPRRSFNRAKCPDGTHVVQFTHETKCDLSQKNAEMFLLLAYRVVESTVPSIQGQTFSCPMFFRSIGQITSLADIVKILYGQDQAMALGQQYNNPQALAQMLAAVLFNQQTGAGYFAVLGTRRNMKDREGRALSYDDAFVNHDWLAFSAVQVSLQQASANGIQVRAVAPPSAVPAQQWAPPPMAPAQQPPAPQGTWGQPPQAAPPQFQPPPPQQAPPQMAPQVAAQPQQQAWPLPPAGAPPAQQQPPQPQPAWLPRQ